MDTLSKIDDSLSLHVSSEYGTISVTKDSPDGRGQWSNLNGMYYGIVCSCTVQISNVVQIGHGINNVILVSIIFTSHYSSVCDANHNKLSIQMFYLHLNLYPVHTICMAWAPKPI